MKKKKALAVVYVYALSNDRIIPGLDSNAHPSLVHSYFECPPNTGKNPNFVLVASKHDKYPISRLNGHL